MKRTLVSLLLASFSCLCAFANEVKEITLNEYDNKSEVIELRNYNIFVTLVDMDIDGNAEISIELENTSETYTLMLFDYAYSEKVLKKSKPVSIRFYKNFDGSKTNPHVIIPCQGINRNYTIRPSDSRQLLMNLTGNWTNQFNCKIPVYYRINKNKKGTKVMLLAKSVAELKINVLPDRDYVTVQKKYQDLKEDLKSTIFCTNQYHQGTPYETLKRQFKNRILSLKMEIGEIVESRNYRGNEKSYAKYKALLDKLDDISIERMAVSQCYNDVLPPEPQPEPVVIVDPVHSHNCKYCRLSYAQIYERLEDYQLALYNNKTKKSAIIADVEALYRCFKENKKRVDREGYKTRITEYYNRIKSYKNQ